MPCYLLISATQITRVIMVYLTCLLVTVRCYCSNAKSLLTLYNPNDCSMPGSLSFTMSQSLLKLLSFALQHWTLLSLPDISTTDCPFPYGPAALFFLELLVSALCCSPVAYWTPSDLGVSSSLVISFCLFILFMEFSWQEYWSGLPFPPPIGHVISELFIITHLSWVVLNGMAYSFIEFCKSSLHDKALIRQGEQCLIVFFLYFVLFLL